MAESLWSNAQYLLKQETVLHDCLWNEAPAFYFKLKSCQIQPQKLIGLFGWITPSDTSEFYGKLKVQLESTLIADRE